jgi:hypothetical protein
LFFLDRLKVDILNNLNPKYGAAAIQDVRMIKQNTEKWRKSLSKKQQNIYNKALTMCNNGM